MFGIGAAVDVVEQEGREELLLAGDDPDQDKLDIAADLLFTMADLESVSWIPEKLLKYIGRAYDLLTQGLTEAEGNYEFDRMHQENLHTLLVSWLVNKPIPVEYMIQATTSINPDQKSIEFQKNYRKMIFCITSFPLFVDNLIIYKPGIQPLVEMFSFKPANCFV